MPDIRMDNNFAEQAARIARLAELFPKALDKGLGLWVRRASRLSKEYLSGGGGTGIWQRHNIGGYPVPVRTGHLRRSDNYVLPGRTKSGIAMRHGQAALVNSARYAAALHDGSGPHKSYGKREFQLDAIENSKADGIQGILNALREARAAV